MPLQDHMKLISVDDHIIEPAHIWQSRLPAKFKDMGPRMIELPEEITLFEPLPDGVTRIKNLEVTLPKGAQTWMYEGVPAPDLTMNAVAGLPREAWEDWKSAPRRYDMIRPGCSDPLARVTDMDEDGVWAQVGFPSWCNFSGTRFLKGKDSDLAFACVVAYNDFILDEWCAAAPERLIPVVILPLWDRDLCVAEIERTASKGAKAVTFPENPAPLGLPSFHSGDWDPVLAAAEAAQMPLCMHFGTSGVVPAASPGGSRMVGAALMGMNSMLTATDLVFSHVFHMFPRLRISLAEGGLGWVPWLLQRLDNTWERMEFLDSSWRPERPSEVFHEHIYACGIDDQAGIDMRHLVGIERTMLESDYPHLDSIWPDTRKRAAELLSDVPDDEAHLITELNARRLFRHDL